MEAARTDDEPGRRATGRNRSAHLNDDAPITVDFRVGATARTWTDEADGKRPHREQLRAALAERLGIAGARCVLELGSGPGPLAERILRDCTIEEARHFIPHEAVAHDTNRGRFVW